MFRTHAEMLTDQRLIIRGDSFPLAHLERAYVRPVWYYAPFLLVRLLILLAAVLLILSFLGVTQPDMVPGNPVLHLFVGLLDVLLVALVSWLVPTYGLWIKTRTGSTQLMMRSTHAGRLQDVRGQIEAAMRKRQQDSHRPALQTPEYAPKMS